MPSARFDTYGFRDHDIDAARAFVEQRLGITLSERDSSYRGRYFRHEQPGGGDILLFSNELDGTPQVSRYAECGVLLEVSRFPRMDDVVEWLTQGRGAAALLESETIEDPDPDDDDAV